MDVSGTKEKRESLYLYIVEALVCPDKIKAAIHALCLRDANSNSLFFFILKNYQFSTKRESEWILICLY
ncbi:hypothetical protein D0T84_00535 [Dysgonomonas sp. 521]|nr:hypothetical protein [Dysgonomonas sp. 521]